MIGRIRRLRFAALLSLDDWLKNKYFSNSGWNDWHGTPKEMRDPLVLLKPWLSKKQLDAGLKVMRQVGGLGAHGANLTWRIDPILFIGALSGDTKLLDKVAKKMAEDGYDNSNRIGIQPDWSFNQHGAILYTFGYGYAYIKDASRLAWLVHGTPWALPDKQLQMFADFILEGAEWMRRGKATIPNTLGREVSRANTLYRPIAGSLRLLRDMLPSRKEQIDAALAREAGSGKALDGNRYFPYGELMVHHRPKFSFFVKIISLRTLPPEVRKWNKENLLGDQLHAGDHYILRHGREYYNMMPVWDWNLLPGVTAAGRGCEVKRQAFVGGVSNGHSGCAAMDYYVHGVRGRGRPPITARKAWFCHGDMVVCLIGDLAARLEKKPLRTALEQSRLAGNVTVGLKGGKTIQPKEGTHKLKDVTWIHHDSNAYIPLAPAPI